MTTMHEGSISARLQPRGVSLGGPPRMPFTGTDLEQEHIGDRAVAALGVRIVGAVDYFASGGREVLDTDLDDNGLPTGMRRHHAVVRLRIARVDAAPPGEYTMDLAAVTSEIQGRLEARILRACFQRSIVVTRMDHRLGATTFVFRADGPQPPRVPEGFTVARGY